jgi:hypothetical protein
VYTMTDSFDVTEINRKLVHSLGLLLSLSPSLHAKKIVEASKLFYDLHRSYKRRDRIKTLMDTRHAHITFLLSALKVIFLFLID